MTKRHQHISTILVIDNDINETLPDDDGEKRGGKRKKLTAKKDKL